MRALLPYRESYHARTWMDQKCRAVTDQRLMATRSNAAHVKNVPGRKMDVNDATWLADLLARHRAAMLRRSAPGLVDQLTQHIQRLE